MIYPHFTSVSASRYLGSRYLASRYLAAVAAVPLHLPRLIPCFPVLEQELQLGSSPHLIYLWQPGQGLVAGWGWVYDENSRMLQTQFRTCHCRILREEEEDCWAITENCAQAELPRWVLILLVCLPHHFSLVTPVSCCRVQTFRRWTAIFNSQVLMTNTLVHS